LTAVFYCQFKTTSYGGGDRLWGYVFTAHLTPSRQELVYYLAGGRYAASFSDGAVAATTAVINKNFPAQIFIIETLIQLNFDYFLLWYALKPTNCIYRGCPDGVVCQPVYQY
jgi:hypothetical protein